MMRLVKTIRNESDIRGYYSYFTEAVIEIISLKKQFPEEELKVYFDLTKVHHYKQENLFDVCFEQDKEDFILHRDEYVNIETFECNVNFNHYDLKIYPDDIRVSAESVIKEYFPLKSELLNELNSKLKSMDLENTISIHRRDTDMRVGHHITAPSLEQYYSIIDEKDWKNIFVMSDNLQDLNLFVKRYSEKVISFEEDTTSDNVVNPFFKNDKSPEELKKHIQNLTLNTFILSKTKKLLCGKSNLSTFAILANPKLEYVKLN
jgi:hypothetical protein